VYCFGDFADLQPYLTEELRMDHLMNSGTKLSKLDRESGILTMIACIALAGQVSAADSSVASADPRVDVASDGVAASASEAASEANSSSGQDQINDLVVTGVRGSQPLTIASSPVPIDIINAEQITATGKVGLKEILSSVIPSFTLPAQNGGGTSASVPPYTVRGLTGDYVLVLVNGKRRHSTALINNLATIGGGSTPVDLDLIPVAAIDHIEVLRDGAAAQYGSDAIAGVINIILKQDTDGGEADATVGRTYKNTGALGQVNSDYGLPLFSKGFIHFALTADHHQPAPANDPSTGLLYPLVGGAPDPREAAGNHDYGSAYGRSTRDNTVNFSYNLSAPLGDGLEFYSVSTVSHRDIKDARGAYRPDDLSSLPQIYPNGFQAYRLIHETDFQISAGVRGQLAGWQWDAGSNFGRDSVWLGAANTLNASLGPSVAESSFYMGKQIFQQWTNNLDVTRAFNVGLAKPLDVSWGLEHRWEQFSQVAGEPNSYINGGYVIPNDGTPFGDLYHGQAPTAGLQSFTGTTPADAGTHHRNNYALYLDFGTNIVDPWYVGLAARGEHYDDSSGNTLSGKFTTRYEILPELALRAAVNNGFRAPSLAEQDFSTTQNTSAVVNGVPANEQVKFLPANSALAQALGARPLTPERSLNYSAGVTFEPTHEFLVTLDAYRIDISDRIVKSSTLTGAPVAAILTPLGFSNLSTAQYFTNAVNTRTDGVDVVVDFKQSLGDAGSVRWSAGYAENRTSITRIKANPAVLSGFGAGFQLFAPLAQRQLTDSTPKDRIVLAADWSLSQWRVHGVETRYGKYLEPLTNTLDGHFGPKWITDLDVTYEVTAKLALSVGANNLFNVYPQRQSSAFIVAESRDTTLTGAPGYKADPAAYGIPTSGADIYGTNSPFGINGGFYYARIGVKF
jgi:iron complex outermembrane receptor protein